MATFTITPTVDQTQEFIEIANDFSNPLDLVREAISNSFDAKATEIHITFDVVKEYGESILVITLRDNGTGMDAAGLQSFFDLGNSLRRGDVLTIGEKGHGTKVFFSSSEINVEATREGVTFVATMKDPYKKLFNREIPLVDVQENDTPNKPSGTVIRIKGYNNNRREQFTQELLKDYILWFTKFGSFESIFGIDTYKDAKLYIKGLNKPAPELLPFGHFFPEDSESISKLFDKHLVDAPDFYCKRIVKSGQLKNFPEIKYQAIFCIEGNLNSTCKCNF